MIPSPNLQQQEVDREGRPTTVKIERWQALLTEIAALKARIEALEAS